MQRKCNLVLPEFPQNNQNFNLFQMKRILKLCQPLTAQNKEPISRRYLTIILMFDSDQGFLKFFGKVGDGSTLIICMLKDQPVFELPTKLHKRIEKPVSKKLILQISALIFTFFSKNFHTKKIHKRIQLS